MSPLFDVMLLGSHTKLGRGHSSSSPPPSSMTCRLSMSESTVFTAHHWGLRCIQLDSSILAFLLGFWPRLAYLERLLGLACLGRWSSLLLLGRTLLVVIIIVVVVIVPCC